jgi:hypothetical protein
MFIYYAWKNLLPSAGSSMFRIVYLEHSRSLCLLYPPAVVISLQLSNSLTMVIDRSRIAILKMFKPWLDMVQYDINISC